MNTERKILFVDSQVGADVSLKELIDIKSNHDMVYCTSIDDTIKTISGSKFDVVIIELMMPTQSSVLNDEERSLVKSIKNGAGIVLLRKIQESNPDIKIIICTSLSWDNDWAEFGEVKHLRKTVRVEKILDTVDGFYR